MVFGGHPELEKQLKIVPCALPHRGRGSSSPGTLARDASGHYSLARLFLEPLEDAAVCT